MENGGSLFRGAESTAAMRDLRKAELGLSQKDAARLTGMEQPELSRIENGIGKRGPSYVTIIRIINAYQSYLRETDPTTRLGLNISVSHGDAKDSA